MYGILIFLIIGLFIAMVFVNVYFRVKVLKTYKKLVQNQVEFGAKHIFSREKMRTEIYPKYPHMKEDIDVFVRHMRYSLKMAIVLMALILLFGSILMYFG